MYRDLQLLPLPGTPMNDAAATILPAMFMVHVIVAIAIAPNTPRHRRSKKHARRGRP